MPVKTASLLTLFLENPNRAFAKDDLTRRIWDKTAVAESSLYRLISDARQALGDDPKTTRFIKTVPRKGSRWAGAVEAIEEEPAAIASPLGSARLIALNCLIYRIQLWFINHGPPKYAWMI